MFLELRLFEAGFWVTFDENNYLQMDIDLSISWQNFRSFVVQQNRTYLRSKTKLDC